MTSGRGGLILELTEWVVFVKGAPAVHAEVLEMAPLLFCFGKFSISTQDITKVFSGGTGIFSQSRGW